MKITIKIWNNYHSELLEIELNGSLKTTELKKPHPSRLGGGAQVWTVLVPHTHVMDKSSGGISQEQESQPHTSFPNPSFQYQEDKSP